MFLSDLLIYTALAALLCRLPLKLQPALLVIGLVVFVTLMDDNLTGRATTRGHTILEPSGLNWLYYWDGTVFKASPRPPRPFQFHWLCYGGMLACAAHAVHRARKDVSSKQPIHPHQ